jgi:hypothetical protein
VKSRINSPAPCAESRHQHARIRRDRLAGGIGQSPHRKCRDDAPDLFRLADPRHERQPGGRAFPVGLDHRGGHRGLDHPRLHVVDGDVLRTEPHGEDFRDHRRRRLGGAVFTALDCHGNGIGRGDIDDRMEDRRVPLARQQAPREGLGEKERRARVHRHAAVVALRGHVHEVAARQHADTRVVDERGQRPDLRLGAGECRVVAGDLRHVEGRGGHRPALGAEGLDGRRQFGIGNRRVQRQREAFAGQFHGDRQPDPAARSGDQRRRATHVRAPCFMRLRATIMRWIWLVPS